jgi:hypothetical protein
MNKANNLIDVITIENGSPLTMDNRTLQDVAVTDSSVNNQAVTPVSIDANSTEINAPQGTNKPELIDVITIDNTVSQVTKKQNLIDVVTIVTDTAPCPVADDNPPVKYITPKAISSRAQLGYPSAVAASTNISDLLPPLNIHTGPCHYDTMQAFFVVDDGNGLVPVPPEESPQIEEPILAKGKGYVLRRSGLYCTSKSGEDVFASNTRLEITGFIRHVTRDESRASGYHIVKSIEGTAILPDGNRHAFVTEEASYKKIYHKLHKDHPDVNVQSVTGPGLENYLTDLYTQAKNLGVKARYTFEYSGWYEMDKGHPKYNVGTNAKLYSTTARANINAMNRYQIFAEGNRFLHMGDIDAVGPIWIFFHAAFTDFFYKKAGCGWGTTLVIEGETGAKKTSVMKILADPLNANRNAGIISIEQNTTEAGLLRVMNHQFCDNFICLDDFTGAMSQSTKASQKMVDMVFRLVGDASSRVKASGKNETANQTANCLFALTAEKNFALTESSYARYIRVFFTKEIVDPSTGVICKSGTIDIRLLTRFQQNPQMIQSYTTLYLTFLEERAPTLVEWIKTRFIELRNINAGTFNHDRLTDAAAHLTLQAELIAQFAVWCGCTKDEATSIQHSLTNDLVEIITPQAELLNKKNDVELFLETLENRADLRKELAETEKIWLENPSRYLGFREDETQTLWINFDDAYARLSTYASSEGYPVPGKKPIPQHLYEAGYSKAVAKVINGKKKYSYLIKSKKGTSAQRRSLLVLYVQKVNEKFRELQKGEE